MPRFPNINRGRPYFQITVLPPCGEELDSLGRPTGNLVTLEESISGGRPGINWQRAGTVLSPEISRGQSEWNSFLVVRHLVVNTALTVEYKVS